MKKLILPLAFSVLLFTGCTSTLLGESKNLTKVEPTPNNTEHNQTPQKTVTQDPNSAEKVASTSSTPDAKHTTSTYIRVPNDQIDFNSLVIDCDLTQEVIHVKQGDKVIRSMLMSSGIDTIPDNTTPLGTFYVQPERGTWFYSEQYQEGAKYWTSWKDHGVFLFHSVVMDKNGDIKKDEEQKLGTKASHGCFRLPVDDAKWIYDNIKVGTKVVVHN